MASTPHPPSIKCRWICMIYESLLLLGLLLISETLFDLLTHTTHISNLRLIRQIGLFLVIGSYFIFFWRANGQTLAMKTWHIQIIFPGYARIPVSRAIGRYLLTWMWVAPALILNSLYHLQRWESIALLVTGIGLWGLTAYLHPSRQFLHDQIIGTQLIIVDPSQKK